MDYEEVWSFGWDGFAETCASCEVNDWFIRRTGSQYNRQTWSFLLLVLIGLCFRESNTNVLLRLLIYNCSEKNETTANRLLFLPFHMNSRFFRCHHNTTANVKFARWLGWNSFSQLPSTPHRLLSCWATVALVKALLAVSSDYVLEPLTQIDSRIPWIALTQVMCVAKRLTDPFKSRAGHFFHQRLQLHNSPAHEAKRCPNPLRIREFFWFRLKKTFFCFGFGVFCGCRHIGEHVFALLAKFTWPWAPTQRAILFDLRFFGN